MAVFLVNIDPMPDGNPDKDLWSEVDAPSKMDALVSEMRAKGAHISRPEVGWVSIGSFRHPNGLPFAVQRYSLKWGETSAPEVVNG